MSDRIANATDCETEITAAMVKAGIDAYYAIARYPGDSPIDEETLKAIFRGMLIRLTPTGARN